MCKNEYKGRTRTKYLQHDWVGDLYSASFARCQQRAAAVLRKGRAISPKETSPRDSLGLASEPRAVLPLLPRPVCGYALDRWYIHNHQRDYL